MKFHSNFFKSNCFPRHIFDNCLQKFLSHHFQPSTPVITVPKLNFRLACPFIGTASKPLQLQLNSLINSFFPFLDCILVFSNPRRIGSSFRFKDKLPLGMSSGLVYKYTCPKCNLGTYVGQTRRMLKTRIDCHAGVSYRTGAKLSSPEHSSVRSQATKCRSPLDIKHFSILASSSSLPDLNILESIFIKQLSPSLHKDSSSTPLHINDIKSVLTDPTKLGLGLLSVFFNIFFFLQHYVIYSFQFLKRSIMSSSLANLDASKLIAVAQMTSTSNKIKNFEICEMLVEEAAGKGAKMVFLPEGCDYIAESKNSSLEMAESLNGTTVNKFCELAKLNKMWLSLGGIHIMGEGENKIRNTHIIINSVGQIVSSYVKAHLFDVSIPEQNIHLLESSYVEAGKYIVNPVPTVCGLVGMGICYDLRFPEFSLHQRILGAELLTFPSAFTVHTGFAHWHTLLKTRAIENQCYVIAAAQTSHHNNVRASFGHALVIDPWGSILCEINEGTGIALAEINLKYLEKVRAEMPVIDHRRPSLYSLADVTTEGLYRYGLTEILPFPKKYVFYQFGQVTVPGGCIFLKTHLSQAFTNKKPFVSGHVLVTPEKPSFSFKDLCKAEICDLAQTVVLSLKALISQYNPKNGIYIAIQDGPNAGQTINHVHVHLVPQHKENDTLTAMYETDNKQDWRDEADMEKEALVLRDIVSKLKVYDKWLHTLDLPSSIGIQEFDSRTFVHSRDTKNFVFFSGKTFIYLASEPILQGHVELSPQTIVTSLADLLPAEVSDLFLCIQIIQKCLEKFYGTSSTTIFIADAALGRKGLVAHVVPRKENDLQVNDDIYTLFKSQANSKFVASEKYCSEDLLDFLKKNIMS